MANATRPVVEILPAGVFRRKRSASEVASGLTDAGAQEAKRWKSDAMPDQALGTEKKAEVEIHGTKDAVLDPSRVRDTIDTQFSLEILLKHNELRLINQELAKCQVALEQLRRCHLIPYPSPHGTPESMLNVSNGTGPALRNTESIPEWAPPYGVADGPYSRHYAKWLIPDRTFDGVEADWNRGFEGSRAGKTVPEGRSTRYNLAEGTSSANKSRSQRVFTGQKLQALSSGYPQAKERAGPCVLKRGDGQMVKLVCLDCNRENFSSTQGFINHCRIAHRRDFKSHEEAAIASGQPIEADEVGGVVGDGISAATGLVHPLIRSAPVDKAAYVDLLSRISASLSMFEQGKLPGITSIPTSSSSTLVGSNTSIPVSTPPRNFIPSSATPHLSALMRSKGFDGNLTEMVDNAKEQADWDELSSHDEDSEEGESAVQRRVGGLDGADSPPPAMRMPVHSGMASTVFGRPGSSKGIDAKNSRKPALGGISPRLSQVTPFINTSAASNHNRPLTQDTRDNVIIERHFEVDHDREMMDGRSIIDLSPNTVASNNAPSLVSDDGEYDDGDDAESASSEDEDADSVAEIDIEDDTVDKVVPETMLRNRAGSGSEKAMRLRKVDKHVTFVSPVKQSGKERRRK